MDSSQRFRARIVLILILIAVAPLVAALYWTQIVRGEVYAAKADEQYLRPQVTTFDRGSIFFSAKDGTRFAAATLGRGYLVFMNPSLLVKPETAYEALEQYIKLDKEDFLRNAAKAGDHYEELSSEVPENVAKSIKDLQLPGISVSKQAWRSYPGGVMAAHELGIIGEDRKSSSVAGRYGLERIYEKNLRRTGSASKMNVFAELFSGLRESVFGEENVQEGDIVMTIEPTAQKYLEKILEQTADTWKPDEIGGIIIDPKTGEIVAMSSLPTFDPNNTAAVKDVKAFSNPLVESSYEMGSIMKPLTMAVALDNGAVTSSSTYEDTGMMVLSGKKISNFDGRARGITSMQEILSQSLNVGAATIALKVGKDEFSKYFLSFGLADKTGIDLPSEATGIAGNLKTGRDVEIATAAYGQGIAVSPVNMARALSILANGGYVITPHVVKKISYLNGTEKELNPEKKGPVLKKESVQDVTSMLVTAVDKALSKGALKNDHYSIAAKTGTAQIYDTANKEYFKDKYLHSFFGYFPAYDSRFLVFLYQVHPKGAEYASATLTKPFDDITKFLIDYYDIPPDR